MYPKQRQDTLLTLLSQHGFVSYRDLAEKLQVSEITIRRDIQALQRQGLVETSVGGGQVSQAANELPYTSKRIMQQLEKEAIASAALRLIEPGMTIGFAAGTTTWMLAKKIIGFSDLTFVTNSTNIAIDLRVNGWTEINITGGFFRTPSDALVGPIAEMAARQFHTDILFMGVGGIDPVNGLSTPNVMEASVNRVLMERACQVVLLADHTKWDVQAMCRIAGLDEIDIMVTDMVQSAARDALAKLGVTLIEAARPDDNSHANER